MIKRILSILATFFLFAGILLSASSEVYANDGGGTGTGGCVGSCNLNGPWYWRYTQTTPGATAWQKFAGKSSGSAGAGGMRRQTVESHVLNDIRAVGMTNKQLLSVCQKSEYVWWVSGSNPVFRGRDNGWGWNLSSRTFPATTSGKKFTEAQRAEYWSRMDLDFESKMIDWVQKRSTRNYVLLCSGFIEEPLVKQRDPIVKYYEKTVFDDNRTMYRHPYSYSYDVQRQDIEAPDGKPADPIGEDNLHDQAMTTVVTNYGKLYNDMKTNPAAYKSLTPTQIKAKVDAALLKDKTLARPSVALDTRNRQGLAEGGVLNIIRYSAEAEIYTSWSKAKTYSCKQVIGWRWSQYHDKWVKEDPVTSCTLVASDSDVSSSVGKIGLSIPQSFWQILSVHCNRDQAIELQQATGATIKSFGSERTTDVLYSKPISLTDGKLPTTLDFGDSTNPSEIKANSGLLEFYTHECGLTFNCISETRNYAPTKAKDNILDSEYYKGENYKVQRYGARSGNVNGSNFVFFRDNKNRKIVTDVWYPELKDAEIVAANSHVTDAEADEKYSRWDKRNNSWDATTQISRWSEGTPDVVGDTKFVMTDEDGRPVFTEDNKVAKKFPGVENTVDVKSSWASQTGKPQLINFKWTYRVRVPFTSLIQVTDMGSPDPTKATSITQTSFISKDCYSQYGQLSYQDPEERSGEWIDEYIVGANDPSVMEIKFVRSTSE